MYHFTFIYFILSLTISTIYGRNHFLDNLDLTNRLPNEDQTNYEQAPSKSYLEQLEEKKIYENELNKIEDDLLNNKELNEAKEDLDDDYLKSINVYPAFSLKELNNQQSSNYDDLQNYNGQIDTNQMSNSKYERNQFNHYLTTMPTELKNQLLSGERLRRAWKKDPFSSYNPSGSIYIQENNPNEKPIENDKKNNLANDDSLTNIEQNLNKEIDLEEFTKYLMAKRNKLENKEKNSESSSGKESDDSKESKESKDSSKESNEANLKNKDQTSVPSNYSTELQKTIISEQNGKEIKKVETYKKSIQLKDKKDTDLNDLLNDESDLLFVNQPNEANYEKMIQHANLQSPLTMKHLKRLDSNNEQLSGHLTLLKSRFFSFSDIYFIGIVIACSMVSILSVIGAGYCFYRFQKHNQSTADVDYPAYGVIGPAFKSSQDDDANSPKNKTALNQESLVNKATNINHQSALSDDASNGSDRKLAQSAQMYHYHHQKQQMISSEKNKNCRNASASDVESDEENEEGDYTVYECPGLAANLGEIEITNPNFQHENVDSTTTETKK